MLLPRALKRTFVVAGLAIYALAIAEVCVRVMSPQALMPRYITSTSWGVRGNIPNATYRHSTPEVDVEYRINAQGLRADKNFAQEKPGDTCRIAMFGDSFFVGYELNLPDTIASQLELLLRQKGYRVEVLNFAVSGFGTGEMLRTYEGYARGFDPDLVLFEWHATDVDDNLRSGLYALEGDKIIPAAPEYLPSVSIQDALMRWKLYRWVADNSHLYSWVRERTASAVKRAFVTASKRRLGILAESPTAAEHPEPELPAGATPYSSLLSAQLLRFASEKMAADNRLFMIADIPDPKTRTTFQSSWGVLPAKIVAGIPVVHAIDAFDKLASTREKVFYEKGAGHITPPAARVLAADIVALIEQLEWRPHCYMPYSQFSGSWQ